MFVGVAQIDFLVPASGSLKDKRRVVRHVTAILRNKFNVSVAEVEHQDLRQRGTLAVSCVSNSSFHARKMLSEVERLFRNQVELEVVNVTMEVMRPDA